MSLGTFITRDKIMKRTLAVTVLLLVIVGCKHGEEVSDKPTDKQSYWQHLNRYSGFSSLVLGGGLTKDALFLFGQDEVSIIDKENKSTHYLKYRHEDINDIGSAVGPSYFAYTYGEGAGFSFRSSLEPLKSTQYSYTAELSLNGEQWLNEVPQQGKVSRPMIIGGAEPFGVFNNNDLFLTLVSAGTEYCYITLIEIEYRQNVDSYYSNIKSTIPIGSPCYSGGSSVSYTTDGENFYVATNSTVGTYKVSPDGNATKIWDYGATNVYFHSNNHLLLQDDTKLYLSKDGGENWELIWLGAFSFNLKFFSVRENLYFYYNKQIFKVDLHSDGIPVSEIDTSGMTENKSYISSAFEFNGKVYVSTFGEGVFSKSVNDFDPSLEN